MNNPPELASKKASSVYLQGTISSYDEILHRGTIAVSTHKELFHFHLEDHYGLTCGENPKFTSPLHNFNSDIEQLKNKNGVPYPQVIASVIFEHNDGSEFEVKSWAYFFEFQYARHRGNWPLIAPKNNVVRLTQNDNIHSSGSTAKASPTHPSRYWIKKQLQRSGHLPRFGQAA